MKNKATEYISVDLRQTPPQQAHNAAVQGALSDLALVCVRCSVISCCSADTFHFELLAVFESYSAVTFMASHV